jgi:hypothetical protein
VATAANPGGPGPVMGEPRRDNHPSRVLGVQSSPGVLAAKTGIPSTSLDPLCQADVRPAGL